MFLICAAGLSGEQMLAALRERLSHEPEAERAVAVRSFRRSRCCAPGSWHLVSEDTLDLRRSPRMCSTRRRASRLPGWTSFWRFSRPPMQPANGEWHVAAHGVTGADGRLRFSPDAQAVASGFAAGEYALTFGTAAYFAAPRDRSFYPKVTITFTVTSGHYHVPLLLSPFAYSTYRGSWIRDLKSCRPVPRAPRGRPARRSRCHPAGPEPLVRARGGWCALKCRWGRVTSGLCRRAGAPTPCSRSRPMSRPAGPRRGLARPPVVERHRSVSRPAVGAVLRLGSARTRLSSSCPARL